MKVIEKGRMFMAIARTQDAAGERDAAGAADAVELRWSVHLMKARPDATWRIVLCAVLVAIVATVIFRSLLLGLVPAAAIVLTLSEFLFPIHYSLTQKGVVLRNGLTWLEMPWTDVRHAYLAEDGVKLSPLRKKNARLEPLRGIFVRFGDQDREAVLDAVRRLRPASAGAARTETPRDTDG
jgi:hypothetical protein